MNKIKLYICEKFTRKLFASDEQVNKQKANNKKEQRKNEHIRNVYYEKIIFPVAFRHIMMYNERTI